MLLVFDNMADLVEEDLEFRGGTLQLSSDNGLEEHNENSRNIATENSMLRERTQNNVNPSVLSGANSLSTSSSSFAGYFYKYKQDYFLILYCVLS